MEITIESDVQSPRQRLGSVGYAYMASGIVPGAVVQGAIPAPTGVIAAINENPDGTGTIGLYGQSVGYTGIGVFGRASATSGTNYGIYGGTNSAEGYGGYFEGHGHFSGNLSIGTTSSGARLEVRPTLLVSGDDGDRLFRLRQNSDGSCMILVYDDADYATVRINGGAVDGSTYFTQGNIGIGTTNPQQKLHINSNDNDAFRISRDGMTSEVNLQIADGDYGFLGLGGSTTLRGNERPSYFDGNVGIGTTNPGYKLELKSSGTGDVLCVTGSNQWDWPLFKVRQNSTGEGEIRVYDSEGSMTIMLNGGGTSYFNTGTNGAFGIGTNNPTYRLHIYDDASPATAPLYIQSSEGVGLYCHGGTTGYGITASGYSLLAAVFYGNLIVTGVFNKVGFNFLIDHPLDPLNKLLRHHAAESPENLVMYRGTVELDGSGEAVVRLPGYFAALTSEEKASIQVMSANGSFPAGAEWIGEFERFRVYGEPNGSVNWQVMADRDDPVALHLRRPVEELKGPDNKLCDQGLYLHPEAYGLPDEMGVTYQVTRSGEELEGSPETELQ